MLNWIIHSSVASPLRPPHESKFHIHRVLECRWYYGYVDTTSETIIWSSGSNNYISRVQSCSMNVSELHKLNFSKLDGRTFLVVDEYRLNEWFK